MVQVQKINEYILVGKIDKRISKTTNIRSAEIYVSRNNLKHIDKNHKKELNQFGISSIDLVKYVVQNFNQINIPTNNKSGYWLIVLNKELSKMVVVDINYSLKNEFWEVITARPIRSSQIEKEQNIIWKKKERTL